MVHILQNQMTSSQPASVWAHIKKEPIYDIKCTRKIQFVWLRKNGVSCILLLARGKGGKGGINAKEFAKQMASTKFSFVPWKAQAETQNHL